MTWEDLARENMASAQTLFATGFNRASLTRSYYAVYCGVTFAATQTSSPTFPRGWNNPGHGALLGLARQRCGVRADVAEVLARICSGLRMAREDADYRPEEDIDSALAADGLREASLALSILKI